MGEDTPIWEPKHTAIAERLEADLKSGEDQCITYPSHEAFMKDLHESA